MTAKRKRGWKKGRPRSVEDRLRKSIAQSEAWEKRKALEKAASLHKEEIGE